MFGFDVFKALFSSIDLVTVMTLPGLTNLVDTDLVVPQVIRPGKPFSTKVTNVPSVRVDLNPGSLRMGLGTSSPCLDTALFLPLPTGPTCCSALPVATDTCLLVVARGTWYTTGGDTKGR